MAVGPVVLAECPHQPIVDDLQAVKRCACLPRQPRGIDGIAPDGGGRPFGIPLDEARHGICGDNQDVPALILIVME
jgi:hypothetical protein